MKKIAIFVFIACAVAASVFAQGYTVESVKGKVQWESNGKMVDVKAGDVLTDDIYIQTNLGASLVLKDGELSITIPANRKGKVSELATAAFNSRTGTGVNRVDTSTVSRTTGQTSTASARASVAVRPPSATDDDDDDDDDDDLLTE